MTWRLSPDRGFDPDPSQRQLARELFEQVHELPQICPHGHVPVSVLADPSARFPSPADVFIVPDHYVFRMLYSQGIRMEDLGIATRDGTPVELDGRARWRRFAEHFALFAGTPTGLWLKAELIELFGISEKPSAENADQIYDQIEHRLAEPDFTPRRLFDRFNIEVFSTTDAATDSLEHHHSLHREGYARVRPTLRPDGVVNVDAPGWRANVDRLSEVSGISVVDYASFLRALEQRRQTFKAAGAFATDHSAPVAQSEPLAVSTASAIFARGLQGAFEPGDAERFTAHMLFEQARMATEDGLVMQLHIGSFRNHNPAMFARFGPDVGADIPLATDFTRGLQPMLGAFGNDPRFRLIVFTVDETTYSRELAPLAGHYPAVYLGSPWWFFDSVNGMQRFLDAVVETAGVYNLAGFNDDTRAFASIAVRHDVWRRVICNWLAAKVVRGLLDEDDGPVLARELAYGCPTRAYRLEHTVAA
ncbi:MAG: glucuronate isomerase [Chloroflexi bacterium]|nr:glucuronate isomerase [Chloroflexota bacterium]